MGSMKETGGITINFEGGNTYLNNVDYAITLTIDSARIRHGFQMAALDNDNKSVGTFTASSGQKVETDAVDKVAHISHNNLPNSNNAIFSFKWKAPLSYQDTVRFYVIAVAANGDKTNSNDIVHFTSKAITFSPMGGLEEIPNLALKIYPTIIENNFHVQWSSTEEVSSIKMWSTGGNQVLNYVPSISEKVSGELIFQRNIDQPSGWYIMQIIKNNTPHYMRVFML